MGTRLSSRGRRHAVSERRGRRLRGPAPTPPEYEQRKGTRVRYIQTVVSFTWWRHEIWHTRIKTKLGNTRNATHRGLSWEGSETRPSGFLVSLFNSLPLKHVPPLWQLITTSVNREVWGIWTPGFWSFLHNSADTWKHLNTINHLGKEFSGNVIIVHLIKQTNSKSKPRNETWAL